MVYSHRGKFTSPRRAFTLIELMLSISIIVVIAGVTIPVNQLLHVKNDLEMATISVSQVIRRAQMLARDGAGDSPWGIKLQSGSATLYKGASYDTRDASFDENTTFPSTIPTSGLDNVNFSKIYGTPQTGGAIKLEIKPYEKNITINEKGTVSY